MTIYGNNGVRTHHSAGGTAGAAMDFFFEDDGREISLFVNVGGQTDYFFRADGDAETAPFALFGVDGDVSWADMLCYYHCLYLPSPLLHKPVGLKTLYFNY